jgi:hypothetical protein
MLKSVLTEGMRNNANNMLQWNGVSALSAAWSQIRCMAAPEIIVAETVIVEPRV